MKRTDLTGGLLCARYAFAPNLWRYCGPETQGELAGYLDKETADEKLAEYLARFETVYPYLLAIAQANGIKDPLDKRVVEAYWVGNELLEKVSAKETYRAFVDLQNLEKRLPKKEMRWLLPKINQGARLHHSFHVFNVFTRTGHRMVAETVETIDSCRISWGKILPSSKRKIPNEKIILETQKLVYTEGKLRLIPQKKEVVVAQATLAKKLKPGDWVSVHWGIVCDQLNERGLKCLEYYTTNHLKLANGTI